MKSHPTRNLIIFVVLAVGGYVWLDPGNPEEADARAAIEHFKPGGTKQVAVKVGRSFLGRRSKESPSVRVWPVTVAAKQESLDRLAEEAHLFYVWKTLDGRWEAESDDALDKGWENLGFFGIFGM